MVDFKMVDTNGQFCHITISAKNFSKKTMKKCNALEKDNDYLTAGCIFPKALISNLIKTKREEVRELSAIVHSKNLKNIVTFNKV